MFQIKGPRIPYVHSIDSKQYEVFLGSIGIGSKQSFVRISIRQTSGHRNSLLQRHVSDCMSSLSEIYR